ncbi:hypothetical protein D0B54_17940 [Solimonas sp. K1W22B-7]|uniref:capsid cement protein n=1 Tax=Solimonas sp. K1W22B-7 TaxID=2303331 RepID=UPI000E32E215|nr:capsid cement protein [Solimonas sp. K1W22B-7]AXQ30442.1 hypothetical protein D0B54_17940 [Solimonas sp. K1W22B-7]
MASRTPAIHTPREFGSDAGIRAARAAVDAIRIRLERLESALDASGDALERQRRALLEAIGRVSRTVETGTPPAGTPRLLVTAAQALEPGQVVAFGAAGAVPADIGNPAHATALLGVAIAQQDEGMVAIATDGESLRCEAWAWNPGDVLYAAADGGLSTAPGSGQWRRRIGVALDSDLLLVLPGEPLLTPGGGRYLRMRDDGRVEAAAIPYCTEHFTVTPAMLAARGVALAEAPADPLKVELNIHHGIEQKPGIDFSVSGAWLSWDGLALALLLEGGDSFSLRYLT